MWQSTDFLYVNLAEVFSQGQAEDLESEPLVLLLASKAPSLIGLITCGSQSFQLHRPPLLSLGDDL
jgi:hypothetical protein